MHRASQLRPAHLSTSPSLSASRAASVSGSSGSGTSAAPAPPTASVGGAGGALLPSLARIRSCGGGGADREAVGCTVGWQDGPGSGIRQGVRQGREMPPSSMKIAACACPHCTSLPGCADLQVLLLRDLSPALLPPILYARHQIKLWERSTEKHVLGHQGCMCSKEIMGRVLSACHLQNPRAHLQPALLTLTSLAA